MKVAGIIAEYNPFHKGHAHHIQQTRLQTGCDYVVVCMDGHFTQRGEPACLSKWSRARMALACGADAVLELPTWFAVRTADVFARTGVGILGGVGVDVLSFGCENEDLPLLRTLAQLRDAEPEAVSVRIREKLGAGLSHARARGEAVGEYLGIDPDVLNQPNLILGAEYVRAIEKLCPNVEPVIVRRIGGYHDATLGEFASASAIRAAFKNGAVETAMQCIPEAARPWAAPDAMHAMNDLLLYRLRGMSMDALAALPDVAEGLEHRLYRLCRETAGCEALLEAMKCKRYTRARLSRLLLHAMLGLTQADADAYVAPRYARLIGMREDAGPLVRALSERTQLPITSDATALKGDACFELECRATDLWALLHDSPMRRLPGREFVEKFVRL